MVLPAIAVSPKPLTDACTKRIKIQLCELHIFGCRYNTRNGGFALQIGVFPVGVLTGIDERIVSEKCIADVQLVPLKQLLQARLRRFSRFSKHSCTIRAELCFIGIDSVFCLVVDGRNRICRVFMAGIANARNRYIMLFPQLFNVFFQILCREAAHGNTTYSLQIAARQLKAEIIRNCPCILAIQLEEVTDLIQYDFIRMCRFYVVIAVVNCVPQGILLRRLVIGCLLIRREVAVQSNQLRDARSDLVLIHLNIRTGVLFQHDTFAAVIFIAAAFSGYSMGMSADTVLFFQKIGALFWSVRRLEKLVDAGLSTLKAAPVRKRSRNFIFGDKPASLRNSRHIGVIFFARQ